MRAAAAAAELLAVVAVLATLLTTSSHGAPQELPHTDDPTTMGQTSMMMSSSSSSSLSPGSGKREALFDGTAYLRLKSYVSVHRHSGLSFRTCEPGKLFEQRTDYGDSIGLLVDHEGLLFFAKLQQKRIEVRLNARLLDNEWHSINMFFRVGNLTLSAAGHTQVVANATYNSEILTLPDHNVNGTLIVGEGFKGCILQGPSILFNDTVNTNALFGRCPEARACGTSGVQSTTVQPQQLQPLTPQPPGVAIDWCKHVECPARSKCVSRNDRPDCQCYPRYSGLNCQIDNGPVCQKNPCMNGGQCVDDVHGDFSCQCPPGFAGRRCERPDRICDLVNPCQHDSACVALPEGDYRCDCRPGYAGKNCEVDVDECASAPCRNHGNCTDAVNGYHCDCERTGYKGKNCADDIDECLVIGPCLNSGSCHNTYGSYVCECQRGFEGLNCELNINECVSSPCHNGGECQDEVGSYRCNCTGTGFAGEHCDHPLGSVRSLGPLPSSVVVVAASGGVCDNALCPANSVCSKELQQCVCKSGFVGVPPNCTYNHCATVRCENGGTCTNHRDWFECVCSPEWKGKNCQINVNECQSQPCKNGGSCIDQPNGYECNCTRDFTGHNCELANDACTARPCRNNGTCVLPPSLSSSSSSSSSRHEFFCECPVGFQGKLCELEVDECTGVECPSGRVCVNGPAGYECKCPDGYREPNCTPVVNPCLGKSCGNGTCVGLDDNNYKCQCAPGYSGEFCDKVVDKCQLDDKSICGNGICVNITGSNECYCKPGYSGSYCEVDINECLCGPCHNNATCIDRVNTFECECPPGFTGKTCNEDINECESDPCMNGATCMDQIARYHCYCLPGFTGLNCETNIDDCESQPCFNHGQCLDGVNSYTCNCTDTGFEGERCEYNIDDCEPNPCTNNATCIDLVKDFKCNCWDGYTGKNCSEDIADCNPSPCMFNGTCLERSNQDLYTKANKSQLPPALQNAVFSYANASGYECLCPEGTMGKNCETNINECDSNPCYEGSCDDHIGSFTCTCNPGFKGVLCKEEINECTLYTPCEHGNCYDRRNDYYCACEPLYGGKNCSVPLTGCNGNACKNNGTCIPYLVNETEHKFNCTCPNGFHGEICDQITTMSLSQSSLVTVNTSRDEGYDIQFRFRTTLPDGLLAMGKGPTYYMLELVGGKLNLRSSILNKWNGVFIGSGLNDSKWQKVFVAINATHLVLSANEEQTIYPINLNEQGNVTFTTTYIGGTVNYLRKLPQGQTYFVGCTEDVIINGEWIYTGSTSKYVEMLNVDAGCPRENQCVPNPCKNNGHCTDRWSDFSCKCERPYLGDTCQYNMTAVTFGSENITNGFVAVKVSDTARRAVRSIVDISMFIRTREEYGDIFYLGSEPSSLTADTKEKTFISAHLERGELLVRIHFNGTEAYTVGGVKLNDGNNHLIQVIRNVTLVQVKINSTEYFRKTISATGQLNVTVLYLGGQPQMSRFTRQADTGLEAQKNFKGIIQDVQISNGSETMVVEFYPLKAKDIPKLVPFGNVSFDREKVLEGVVSDNVCASNPCSHNGTCHITWNDFWCKCPRGYTGKTCQEMEFCQLQDCPTGSKCQNLDDGYECMANATFDGISTSFTYLFRHQELTTITEVEDEETTIDSVKITYRSNTGGTLMHIAPKSGNTHFTVSVFEDKVTVAWKLNMNHNGILTFGKPKPDGNWTTILIKLNNDSIECTYEDPSDDVVPQISQNFNFKVWYELLLKGSVTLGGLGGSLTDRHSYMTYGMERHIDHHFGNSVDLIDQKLTTAIPPRSMLSGEAFKGCLSEVRIGNMLLHYFTYEEVYQNANFTPLEYLALQQDNASTHENIGCRLCFEENCKNDGHCLDQYSSYVCDCPPGYAEDDCSVNIDECIDNKCANNSTCIDGIANYTCECKTGWQGWLCEEDVNECASLPCQNDGVCDNLPGSFHCECPEQYIGEHCEHFKVITCADEPCKNGSTCIDEVSQKTGDNYTCSCMIGYEGKVCDTPYCLLKKCQNDGKCVFSHQPPQCSCPLGFTGLYCETNIDDCVPDLDGNVPCKNEGKCHDGINSYTCDCTGTGYSGPDCSEDIDECADPRTDCSDSGHCENLEGSYRCICDPGFCGHNCKMVDPCQDNDYCKNGGTCQCVDGTGYRCVCPPEYSGQNCTESEHFLGSQAMDIAVIVGPIIGILFLVAAGSLIAFFMMARKKRATRGTYSPSAQEFSNPRVEMDNVMKPPPEERLI